MIKLINRNLVSIPGCCEIKSFGQHHIFFCFFDICSSTHLQYMRLMLGREFSVLSRED